MPTRMEETGIQQLDDVTGGLPDHGLTMIVGAPGTGKTVLAFQIATHRAKKGSDIIFLSVYSEPHEKLTEHMSDFSFFDPALVGSKIELLSLKSELDKGVDQIVDTIVRTARGKERPLIVLDGYRGLRETIGAEASREMISRLSSQLPYLNASGIITMEGQPLDPSQHAELTSADALIGLYYGHRESQGIRLLEVVKLRGRSYKEGLHGFTITNSGFVVFPRLASLLPPSTPRPTSKRYKFDLPEFDAMLEGGLPEFSTTVIFGDPGTGRTTFALHYMLAGAKVGEHGLMISFRTPIPDLLEKADSLGTELRSYVDHGLLQLVEVPPVEINPYEFAWRVREIIERDHPSRLVLDSVTDLERTAAVQAASSGYLGSLNVYLRRSGVTSVMTADTGSLYALALDSVNEVRMPYASNRILLRRVTLQGRFHRIFSIVNMERSNHETAIREFVIGKGGVRAVPAEESNTAVLAAIAQ